jgi:hypothetical protein
MEDPQTQEDLKATGRTLDQALSDFLHAEHSGIRALGKTPVSKAGTFRRLLSNAVTCC